MIEPLTLASFNVQGLGRDLIGVRKRRDIRDFFQKSHPRPDTLMVQEHKLSLEKGKKNSKQLEFGKGLSLWNEALYNANTDSFNGGTALLISDRITSMVKEHGVIIPGRAQYVTFQWTPHIKVGVINIYAYN